MPKTATGYITPEIEALMGGRSVVQIAQELHELCTGARQAMDSMEIHNRAAVVDFYLSHWTPSKTRYERAVFQLLDAAWDEYDNGTENDS